SRWQAALEQRQGFLGRVVDIGAELWAISATCVRARRLADAGGEEAAAAGELADLFCTQARRRVDALFTALWHNEDAADYAAAQKVLEGRYRFIEEGVLDPSGGGPMIASSETAEGSDIRS
ncbi:MAG TPA: hypothetical protein VKU91_08805, partial [Acidimicrobiales bacterium]|nr:hypothetical protein [Acidimicrobiales bacterium]